MNHCSFWRFIGQGTTPLVSCSKLLIHCLCQIWQPQYIYELPPKFPPIQKHSDCPLDIIVNLWSISDVWSVLDHSHKEDTTCIPIAIVVIVMNMHAQTKFKRLNYPCCWNSGVCLTRAATEKRRLLHISEPWTRQHGINRKPFVPFCKPTSTSPKTKQPHYKNATVFSSGISELHIDLVVLLFVAIEIESVQETKKTLPSKCGGKAPPCGQKENVIPQFHAVDFISRGIIQYFKNESSAVCLFPCFVLINPKVFFSIKINEIIHFALFWCGSQCLCYYSR